MAQHAVRITEFSRKTIIVDVADGEDILDSIQKVTDAYVAGEIILDGSDYDDTDFEPSPYFGNGTGVVEDEDVSGYLCLPNGG